ncbi:hypothetical protein [Pseudomonas sp.]|uniref:hypothetical protein n=1 Tax=Pseudomonas sp. TaxID=306 RepID=UPI00258A9FAD|nr:hypothetical protein [Pseudomonas sp.]
MTQNEKRYTSVSKGGEFEIVGTSSGAGQRKGDVVIVYRNVETGQVLHREPEDFAMRMKPITKPEINAQLLAALSDALEWIDAVPSDMPLPAMPGFDRDAVNELIAAAKGAV